MPKLIAAVLLCCLLPGQGDVRIVAALNATRIAVHHGDGYVFFDGNGRSLKAPDVLAGGDMRTLLWRRAPQFAAAVSLRAGKDQFLVSRGTDDLAVKFSAPGYDKIFEFDVDRDGTIRGSQTSRTEGPPVDEPLVDSFLNLRYSIPREVPFGGAKLTVTVRDLISGAVSRRTVDLGIEP